MKILKPALTCLAVASITFGVNAKMAKPGIINVSQPDGTPLEIKITGDEYMHFVTDKDGNLLHEDANGFYTYGTLNAEGAVVSTGVSATAALRNLSGTVNIKDIDLSALAAKRNVAQRRLQSFVPFGETVSSTPGKSRAPQSGKGLVSSTYPRTGSPKGLIILVEFSDLSFTLDNPAQYFGDMINKPGFNEWGGTGSALDYYTEQSNGVFTPSFDVLGPVKLPNTMSYYGANDIWGDDQNAPYMVTHAVQALNAEVDFSVYDTDKDGVIDNIYVYYAGRGEASGGGANTVWPHSFDVRYMGLNVRVDGVLVGHYACSNEWEYNRPDGVGTFIHEFSHVMGLPDLYATDYNHTNTPGTYSVLDGGSYNNNSCTPPNYGAFERNAMSWMEPIILEGDMSVTLQSISSGQFGLVATASDNEFFLFENRQKTGWDKYIPGHGMLIWHIDYKPNIFENNEPNDNRNHMCVAIEKANGIENNLSTSALAGWPFPGTTGKDAFTATTTPGMITWAGVGINTPITNIKEQGGEITFDVGNGIHLGTPEPYAELSADETYFTARWDAVEDATDYVVTVYCREAGESGQVSTSFDGSKPGDGWTTEGETMLYYTSASNTGAAAPSLRFTAIDQALVSPMLPAYANRIEFWARGVSSSTATTLSVEGLVNDEWVRIRNYTPQNMSAETVVITDDIPDGVRRVRFVYTSVKGNVAIDDVVISYGAGNSLLPDYNKVATGGQTSLVVDKLIPGQSEYFFNVYATDGVTRSAISKDVYVTVKSLAGVDNITADSNVAPVYYNLQGVRIGRPVKGDIVIERRGNVVRKIVY